MFDGGGVLLWIVGVGIVGVMMIVGFGFEVDYVFVVECLWWYVGVNVLVMSV